MNKVIAMALLVMSGASLADSSGASSSAGASIYQSAPQTNLLTDSYLPSSYVGMNGCSTPTAVVGFGIVANHNEAFGNLHSNGQSIGADINIPWDLNGTDYRCEKLQNAIVRIREVELNDRIQARADRQRRSDTDIIKDCLAVKRQGVILDPEIFPWAEKCKGVIESRMLTAFQK